MSEAVIDVSFGGVAEDEGIRALITGDTLGLPDSQLTYSQLFDRYATSHYGLFHASQEPRFHGRYAYDHAAMIADLGDDVHPVQHMSYTESQILRPLMLAQHESREAGVEQFTAQEIVAGRLAMLLHDTGENKHPELLEACGKVVGDVVYWDKTDEDEKDESKIRHFFYGALFDDVPDDVMMLAEDAIMNREGTTLREGFATAEHIGYLVTGINAGIKAIEIQPHIANETDEHRFNQLKALGSTVAVNWYERLADRDERFPFVGQTRARFLPQLEAIQDKLVG